MTSMTTGQANPAIRPITEDEFPAFSAVMEHAFAQAPDEDQRTHEAKLIEFQRTLAAFVGSEMAATAAAYSYDMTVPGGTVPTAGVTWVSVLPTHRRRGLLTALMRRQLDDIYEAGREPVAALWASEAGIYGRVGYGLASTSVVLTVPRGAGVLRAVAGADGLLPRFVETSADETLALVHALYEHERARRPGMVSLTPAWQQGLVFDPPGNRKGGTPLRTVVIDGDDGPRAVARYAVKGDWNPSGPLPIGKVIVRDAYANDAPAAWALWRHLTDIDLTVETRARRPLDDPLRALLVDPRRAQPAVSDDLYIRLVDVGAALAARTYAVPVDVVLDVTDKFCPWNAGRWRLVGDTTGARCEPTDGAASLSIDARELGAAYLGSTSVRGLADAGLITEHAAGAVNEMALAFSHPVAAFAPFVF
jgi:predicted acetyltransferase